MEMLKLTRCTHSVLLLWLICIILFIVYSLHSNSQSGAATQMEKGLTAISIVREAEENSLEEAARAIYVERGVVAFAVINDAYLPLALSWSCNTEGMAGVHESVLFLTNDTPTALRLRALFPRLTVFSLVPLDRGGAQEYERTRLALRLLEAGIRLLLFEVDCLWLSDPVPALLARHRDDSDDTDIVACIVSLTGDKGASGFLLVNPSEATLKLWRFLTFEMLLLYDQGFKVAADFAAISETFGDHLSLILPLVQKRYAGVKVLRLPLDLYADSKGYDSRRPRQPLPDPRPVINNSWVIGREKKVGPAQAYGHWFSDDRTKTYGHWLWDDRAEKCNVTTIHNLFR